MKSPRLQHARVFNGRNPDLGVAGPTARDVVKHSVVRFRGARRENNFRGVTTQRSGNLLARFVQCRIRARAETVRAGRISDKIFASIQPGLPRFRQQRRRGIVIEINHAAFQR